MLSLAIKFFVFCFVLIPSVTNSSEFGDEVNVYCQPDNATCWPSTLLVDALRAELRGTLLSSNKEAALIRRYSKSDNTLINTLPYFIAFPSSNTSEEMIDDIRQCLKFIKRHSLLLSIYSTGHSFTGRSVGYYNNSFQINLSQHKKFVSNYNHDSKFGNSYLESITVETGNYFELIYSYINDASMANDSDYIYLFTGGYCPTVGIGGYIMGGGHSPIASYLGLGMLYCVVLN